MRGQSTAGKLSGVKADGWVGLRLAVDGESLHMQFQAKGTEAPRPKASLFGDELSTAVGQWYQYKVTFTRVSDEAIRVTGEVRKASEHGKVGSPVGSFPPTNYWVKDFPIAALLDDHDLWVAMRANGAGGVSALDNLRIIARPLPVKASTPTPDTHANGATRDSRQDRMNGYFRQVL